MLKCQKDNDIERERERERERYVKDIVKFISC